MVILQRLHRAEKNHRNAPTRRDSQERLAPFSARGCFLPVQRGNLAPAAHKAAGDFFVRVLCNAQSNALCIASQATNRETSMTPNKPKPGDRGRYHVGSDCYPITCISVTPKGREVKFRSESFKAGEGHDYYGTQVWECYENPDGAIHAAHWSEKRQRYQLNGCGSIFFDGWHARQDPSF